MRNEETQPKVRKIYKKCIKKIERLFACFDLKKTKTMDTNLFTSETLDNAASIFVDPHIGRAHGTSIGWPSNSYNS